jgi:hypothetical protein
VSNTSLVTYAGDSVANYFRVLHVHCGSHDNPINVIDGLANGSFFLVVSLSDSSFSDPDCFSRSYPDMVK